MFRTLLTTTAIVAVMQTGAFAADNQTGDAMTPTPFFQEDGKYERRVDEQGYFEMGTGQILANTLIGKSVYNRSADDAEAIGDVNDIVISSNGDAEAVIIGVGGFLGLGEKEVAIDFKRVGWVDRDGERWIVVDATKEELEAAPAYDRAPAKEASSESDDTMTTAANQQSGDETVKPVDQTEETAQVEEPAKDQTQAPAETAETMDHEKMQTVELASIAADELDGATVYGENQEEVGEITEVIVNDSGKVESFVVEVGGFLGINAKSVAVDAENIDFRKTEDGELVVFTPFTEEQLEQQAAYKSEDKDGYENMKAPRS